MKDDRKEQINEGILTQEHEIHVDEDGNIIIEPWMDELSAEMHKIATEVIKSGRYKH